MKNPVNLSLFLVLLLYFSCSEDLLKDQDLPDDVTIDMKLSKKAPEYDGISLPATFSSFIFYDNIQGPDGILLLNKNKLLVTKEFGGNEGVYLAKRGSTFSLNDAFSTLGEPFDSPDDITADDAGVIYVADGQAQTVFKLNKNGGNPIPFVTVASTGSPSFNPFGVDIAPADFDGTNVDPGDLIVADNAFYNPPDNPLDPQYQAVWAVNRVTGNIKAIVQGVNNPGKVLDGGPIIVSFNSEGTLYVTVNLGTEVNNKLVTIDAEGNVSTILTENDINTPFFAIHPLTDDIYYKVFDDQIGVGQIFQMRKDGTGSTLFANNLGTTRAGTQDMVFNKQGTSLYISFRGEGVIEIYNKRSNW